MKLTPLNAPSPTRTEDRTQLIRAAHVASSTFDVATCVLAIMKDTIQLQCVEPATYEQIVHACQACTEEANPQTAGRTLNDQHG